MAPLPGTDAVDLWTSLDPDGPARVVWPRAPGSTRVTVLMGAFDPPTNAHVDVLRAAARVDGATAVLCLTKVLLARPPDELLSREQRIDVLLALTERLGAGLAFANRGTYRDVGRALRADGIDATFVVGADKIAQLADPSFYDDGIEGVVATFEELRFVVVPRGDVDLTKVLPAGDIRVLEPPEVFSDDATAAISGSDVRRLLRLGEDVSGLVPPEVALALRGYTSAR
jgi:nicotinic acid mononucleotide adenylyltransferase